MNIILFVHVTTGYDCPAYHRLTGVTATLYHYNISFEGTRKPLPDPSERGTSINFTSPRELRTKSPEVTPLFESKSIHEEDQVLAITSIRQVNEVVAQLSGGRTHYINEVGYGATATHAGTKIPEGYELYFNRFPQSKDQTTAWYPVKELGTMRGESKVVINCGSIEKTPISDRSVRLVLVKKAEQSGTDVVATPPPTSTRKTEKQLQQVLEVNYQHRDHPKKPHPHIGEKGIPSPEAKEVRDITEWGVEVKRLLANKEAQAFVNARTNFDITEKDGKQVVGARVGHREGYGYTMLRGGVTEKQAEAAYLTVTGFVHKNNREYPSRLEEHTLYITRTTHDRIEQLTGNGAKLLRERLGGITEGKTILTFDYLQKKVDRNNRSGGKFVYLIVPDEIANKFNALVEAGARPNDIHQSLVSIFTTAETKKYFDASLLNTRGSVIEVTKKPIEPKFSEVKFIT